jgi:NADPH:quinone reductase-like Zn-dependent oxidoreductase
MGMNQSTRINHHPNPHIFFILFSQFSHLLITCKPIVIIIYRIGYKYSISQRVLRPQYSTMKKEAAKKLVILGQDLSVILAVVANVLSWLVSRFFPQLLPQLPKIEEQDKNDFPSSTQTKCIAIGRPGGMEQLRLITLKPGFCTCGYNIENPTPFFDISGGDDTLPSNTVVLRVRAFSINYADCCIRWGLYESANQFVGWPIVPGFDVAGVVERVSSENSSGDFKVGDAVFGATFFGAYSTRVLVPNQQLRKIPKGLSMAQAASLPAVSLTALYALYLGGQYPVPKTSLNNKSILIHSAAGGVGTMLVQISKLLQLSPVVGVVGRSNKVDACKAVGCDIVIDKSTQDIWKEAEQASPQGYGVVADANGVSTLRESYNHLAPTGRVIVFGFHSNLPMNQDLLSPMEWIRMIWKMIQMPKINPMDLTASNKSMLGFNLSFFVKEVEMLGMLYDQIVSWLEQEKLICPRVEEMNMEEIARAHELIQSGTSVGKIVMMTNVSSELLNE